MEEVTQATGKVNFLIDGFPRSLDNWNGYKEVFGITDEAGMPNMLFFECPLPVLEERILKRAKYSGRSDDNVESLRKRFNTYKDETMPTVNIFRDAGKALQVDTSLERTAVYKLVKDKLAKYTDSSLTDKPLSERAEMLLGLRPYPKREKKPEDKKEEKKVEKKEEKPQAKEAVVEKAAEPEKKEEEPAKVEDSGSWLPTLLVLGAIAAGGAAYARHQKMF